MPNPVTVTTPSDREIAVTRSFAAPRSRVYESWTKPELLARWLTGPEGWVFAVCEMDLREGGSYRGCGAARMALRWAWAAYS